MQRPKRHKESIQRACVNRSLLFCPNQTALLKCFQVKSHGLENNALDLISPPVHAALLSLLEKCIWCVAQFSWRKAFGLKAGSSLVTAFIPKHTAETTRAAANALQATARRTCSLWKLTSFTSRKHAGAGKLQQANETQKTFLPFTLHPTERATYRSWGRPASPE